MRVKAIKKVPYQIGVGCGDFTNREKKYVMDVLAKGRLSYGPYSKKFEEMFANLHGCNHAVLVNSGTSALRMAVSCLKEAENWQDGDEVICPAVTFVASANVILMNNLKPVFADVDAKTYNIDPAKIEERITPKTRAIMVVHLFGQPADMDPILKIAKKHNLKIIEDSCETMFARYKGKPVGSFGDISCFSTFIAHIVVTGVGGLACTNNKEYAIILRSLANHGRDGIYYSMDDDKNLDTKGLAQVVSRRFNFIRPGYSFRVTEMEAALGVAQLERKDKILAPRAANAAYFMQGLKPYAKYLQLPSWPKHADHVFMVFPLVIKPNAPFPKKDLVMHLEEHNIETRDMVPLVNQPIYKKTHGEDLEDRYPVAKWINNNGFYIASHQKLSRKDCNYMISVFHNFFENRA